MTIVNKVSIRKARKEDGYNQRRNLAAQAKAQAENHPQDKSIIIEQLAIRCQALLTGLQHRENEMQRKSLRAFVYLMSSGVPPLFDDSDPQHDPLWQIICAAIPHFVSALDLQDVPMQSDAAFALRFIASMDHSEQVIQSGALPKLVVLLRCGISELQIQAAWCLGNVASESKPCCEAVVQVCPPIQVLPHIRMSTPSLRRASVWLLRSMIDMPEILAAMNVLTPQLESEVLTVLANVIRQLVLEKSKGWTKEQEAATRKVSSAAPWRLFEVPRNTNLMI
jgi:importin subunit alpha-1